MQPETAAENEEKAIEDDQLMKRIEEINAWADLRHNDRGISVPDHRRCELYRMEDIISACRESKSPWGSLILSALPDGCIRETNKLAAILAKQHATNVVSCTDDPCSYLDRDESEYLRYLEESQGSSG